MKLRGWNIFTPSILGGFLQVPDQEKVAKLAELGRPRQVAIASLKKIGFEPGE